MVVEKNFYQILEAPFGASDEEIKNQYRELAKRHHPDNFQAPRQKDEAHEIMIQLNAAYAVLSKPDRRKEYDEIVRPTLEYEPSQDDGNELSSFYFVNKTLEELLQALLHFQNSAIDEAKAAYFADQHRLAIAKVRQGAVVDGNIQRRKARW